MEGINVICLIHGPGWFSETMMTEDPFVKLWEKKEEENQIDLAMCVYFLCPNPEYFDENNLNFPGCLTSMRKSQNGRKKKLKDFYLSICTICLDIWIHLLAK